MIDEYRREYADFNRDLTREFYLFNSGRKDNYDIGSIYDRYGDLFSPDAIDRLTDEFNRIPPHFETSRKELKHLLAFAINYQLDAAAKDLTEQISRYESSATTQWNGNTITFQDAAVLLATEPDSTLRRKLYDWRLSVIAASNDLRAERITKLHEAARNITVIESAADPQRSNEEEPAVRNRYGGYTAVYEALYETNYSGLAAQAETFLTETDNVFELRLREAVARELRMSLEQATRPDGIYFVHLSRYDDVFAANNIMRVYNATMEALGISPAAQTNIKIDAEDRPKKNPRAFCAPVLIPEEIHLVYRPFGGQSDYLALLHEAGHSQHYAWTSASLTPEFRYTGDPALTETYAFLFNHLASDETWLSDVLGLRDSRDLIVSTLLTRLLTARRYAGKLIYELKLHSTSDFSAAAGSYSELQTRGMKFATGETEFLFDLDDSFYSAAYLKAWAFEVMLRDYLKRRFSSRWWASKRAGNFLKEIWETGEQYTAEEMAIQIGVGPISFDLLIDEFKSVLR